MEEHPTRSDVSTIEGRERDQRPRVLHPVIGERSAGVLHFAAGLAAATDAVLVVGHVDTTTGSGEVSMDASREAAATLLRTRSDSFVDVPIESHAISGTSAADAITNAATDYDAALVVFGRDAPDDLESTVASTVACDTVVVNERETITDAESILVAVGGGPNTDAVLDVAGALATANDASVSLLHVVDETPSSATLDGADSLLDAAVSHLPSRVSTRTTVVEAADVVGPITDRSAAHDYTIIGAPTKGRLRRFVFDSHTDQIREAVRNAVAMVRRN